MVLKYEKAVEKWGVFEVSVPGKSEGNPFVDYAIEGEFTGAKEQRKVAGFYDGDGIYKVRFMPVEEGAYTFQIKGSFSEQVFEGEFAAGPPTEENHGPVQVTGRYHFSYCDGSPYYSIGTTCYAWVNQEEEMQEMTLRTLKDSTFNKIRFCIFPKHYDFNFADPVTFPYLGTPVDSSGITKENFRDLIPFVNGGKFEGNDWDFKRFNTDHFRRFEKRIDELCRMGIEADIILFHPYDRWGFSAMGAENDALYLKYVIARFGAYRNVWWSLANEYDLIGNKTIADWENIAAVIAAADPYGHLRSIHNCRDFYDYSKPWITHCSMQRQDLYKEVELTDKYQEQYGKPVVWDEIAYEGNIQYGWGNITGEEMIRRFWEATVRGGYAGHGETLIPTPDYTGAEKLWWSHGGRLFGDSPARLQFLGRILKEIPDGGRLKAIPFDWDVNVAVLDDPEQENMKIKDFYLFYFSFMRPSFRSFHLDEETKFQVDVIDTWNMVVTPMGVFKGKFNIPMGMKQYMAVRLRKIKI